MLNACLDIQSMILAHKGWEINTVKREYLWGNFSGESNAEGVDVCLGSSYYL